MAEKDDRLRILQMIEEGKLDAAEGARILATGNQPDFGDDVPEENVGKTPRWVRVVVKEIHSGRIRVNVKVPVNLVSTGIKMGAHLSADMQVLNTQQINDYVRRGVTGTVMEVVDEDEGEKVTISLEE